MRDLCLLEGDESHKDILERPEDLLERLIELGLGLKDLFGEDVLCIFVDTLPLVELLFQSCLNPCEL